MEYGIERLDLPAAAFPKEHRQQPTDVDVDGSYLLLVTILSRPIEIHPWFEISFRHGRVKNHEVEVWSEDVQLEVPVTCGSAWRHCDHYSRPGPDTYLLT